MLKKNEKTVEYLIGVSVAFFALVLYGEALTFAFVNWDDYLYVAGNRLLDLKGLNAIYSYMTVVVAGNWFPVTLLSYKLDYFLWGMDPFGFHLSSILLHSVNTFLVYILSLKIYSLANAGISGEIAGLKRALFAVVAATLFAVHPLHVESVAWIAERKDVLCAFFYILSVICYIEHKIKEEHGKRNHVLAVIAFCLALMSKPMAVTLPVILVLLDFYPFMQIRNLSGLISSIKGKLHFFAISLFASGIAIFAQKKALAGISSLHPAARIVNSIENYVFYIYKSIFPWKLLPLYPYPEVTFLISAKFVLSFTAIVLVIVVVFKTINKKPYYAAAIAGYFLMLLPVIGIVQFGKHVAADRFMYLPSIPIFLLVSAAAVCIPEKTGNRAVGWFSVAFVVFITVVFSIKTHNQILIWKNSITLWTHEIEEIGRYNSFAYQQRAMAYNEAGRYDKSIADMNIMIEHEPLNPAAYNYRGLLFMKVDDKRRAVEDFTTSLRLNRHFAPTYDLIGYYVDESRKPDAIFLAGLREKAVKMEAISDEDLKKAINCLSRF